MSSLKQLAFDALGQVTVYVSEPYNYPGTVFNERELAFIKVTITNNTGLTLRDVVASTGLTGAAKIEPWTFIGFTFWDGEESWAELRPYETREYYVRIKGMSSGAANVVVWISAEVVPYSSRYRAGRVFTVYKD